VIKQPFLPISFFRQRDIELSFAQGRVYLVRVDVGWEINGAKHLV
jgi:hypothetical protein